jgi:hypothetical protein
MFVSKAYSLIIQLMASMLMKLLNLATKMFLLIRGEFTMILLTLIFTVLKRTIQNIVMTSENGFGFLTVCVCFCQVRLSNPLKLIAMNRKSSLEK